MDQEMKDEKEITLDETNCWRVENLEDLQISMYSNEDYRMQVESQIDRMIYGWIERLIWIENR